jgi:hypothetical protein
MFYRSMVSSRTGPQHEAAVAIAAFDVFLGTHFEIHARMAQRAAGAVANDAGVIDFDDFWHFDGHGGSFGLNGAEYSRPLRHRNTTQKPLEREAFRA